MSYSVLIIEDEFIVAKDIENTRKYGWRLFYFNKRQ
jgi:hypothetical protein